MKNNEITLQELKKSIDRLAVIELVKSAATREQIRDVMGSINNIELSKIKKALSNKQKLVSDKEVSDV